MEKEKELQSKQQELEEEKNKIEKGLRIVVNSFVLTNLPQFFQYV